MLIFSITYFIRFIQNNVFVYMYLYIPGNPGEPGEPGEPGYPVIPKIKIVVNIISLVTYQIY